MQIIRMLTQIIVYGHKIEEEVKTMQCEIKKNIQGTNCGAKETGTQINNLEQKEEINTELELNEEKEFKKKMRRGLGTSGTTLNILTSVS